MSIESIRIRGTLTKSARAWPADGRAKTPGKIDVAITRGRRTELWIEVSVADLLSALQVLRATETPENKRLEVARA